MAAVPHYNAQGEKIGEVHLDDTVFGEKPNPVLLQQVVVAQQANSRQPIANTKTRGEVRGGGKKPWKQKGTGRARHGSIRSPIWRGGGVTFGPRSDRNFSKQLPAKARRKAVRMALTDKVASQQFVVLDSLSLEKPKTKKVAAVLKKIALGHPTLLVVPDRQINLIRSVRNLSWVTPMAASHLNTVDLLKHRSLVAIAGAVEKISQTFGKRV